MCFRFLIFCFKRARREGNEAAWGSLDFYQNKMRSSETRGQEVKGNSGGRCNWGSASLFFFSSNSQKKYKWNECGKMSLITQVNTGGSSAANENIRIFLAFSHALGSGAASFFIFL